MGTPDCRRGAECYAARGTCALFSCHMREAPMTLSVATTSGRSAGGSIEVISTGAALGAEVRGIDLKRLDEAALARVVQAWHDYSVVLVRDQRLNDQELIAF